MNTKLLPGFEVDKISRRRKNVFSFVSSKAINKKNTDTGLFKGVEKHNLTHWFSFKNTSNSVFLPLFFVFGNERTIFTRCFDGF